ncbi:MAG: hypothetical protein CMB56_002940 [Methanobacteriota archaeon]|nr:MAG: hypothetical protein CMB56_002940 [Euryarchaeota archaeon]|tara:strand:+ start:27217 stop:27945 length:729 start_codon:yes stop_codon:yes gene_type:complete
MDNSKLGLSLLISGLGVAGTGLLLGLFYAPSVSSNEWNAPEAYRIIFWHVPAAWTSFITFGMLFVGSLGWMLKRKEWAWKLCVISAELSLLFGLCVVISGPIWGMAEWGVPWDFGDLRLNTYAVLSGVALYLVMSKRSQPDTPEFRDVFSGIGMFGFLLVPITFIATVAWQVRHPAPIIGPTAEPNSVDPIILQIWLLSFLGFLILMAGQAILSSQVYNCEKKLQTLQTMIDDALEGGTNGQ